MNDEIHGGATVSCLAIGLMASLVAYFVFGVSAVTAMLLFLPAKALARDIINNDGFGIVRSALVLAAFPLVPALSDRAYELILSKCDGAANAREALSSNAFVVRTVLSIVSMFILHTVAGIIAGITGGVTIPNGLHKVMQKAMDFIGSLLMLLAGIALVRSFDENVIRLSPVVKIIVALGIGGVFALAIRRILSKEYYSHTSAKSGARSAETTRLKSTPATKLCDVVGMNEAKEQIKLRMIEPLKNPGKAARYGLKVGGGVLLYGPPGTGKTMLARGIAGELGLPFYMITAADVFGKYVGESEKNIRAIFSEIRKNSLSVVFIDELETLFPSRDKDVHETTRKVISVILQELDGLDQSKNPVLLVGATNVPWMVDEAFLRPGRFDVKIFVGLPERDARVKMISKALSKGSIRAERELAEYIADSTKNYSGADLNGVADRMRQIAYARSASAYTRAIADEAVAAVKPTANGALMDQIHDWEAQVSGGSAMVKKRAEGSGAAATGATREKQVTLKDVAGMEDVKKQIQLRLLEPLRNATLARHYGITAGGGMLLYGPPGTGKTLIARAVAGELDLPFYMITSADIFGKYVGDAERNVKRIFRDIRKNDLSVVFIDELETLFPKRTENVHETTRKVISMLLQELDGLDDGKNPMLLIGATNVPWMVDEAFLRPGRFDVKVFVGLPDFEARRYMIDRAINKGEVRYEEGIDAHIASKTEGFSGADMKGVFEKMRQTAFFRRLPYYTKALADEILATCTSSASGEILSGIAEWEKRNAITK